MNQSQVSIQFYGFEQTIWDLPSFALLRKRKGLAALQDFAALVWAAERGKGKCPVVMPTTNEYSSYCDGTICLVVKHRNLAGLLHELAHALGPKDKLTHGPAFRRRCMRLYRLYGGWSGEIYW